MRDFTREQRERESKNKRKEKMYDKVYYMDIMKSFT